MKYFVRSLKYFFALCVLCIALMGLMLATGTSALSLDDTLYVMLHTDRYLMLFVAIVVLAAVYPKFGFVVRRVEGDIEENREQILNAFRSAGFSLRSDEDGVMTFRADNFGQRLMLLCEDEIKVSQYGQWIVIDGIRRGVARVHYRLDSYIHMTRND
ncbi:hypothetical protein [Alistipes sp.]|uniref:hypothetical protein n=1 Tax=Alistipes sp. TaxID=1872444 RepID=UPI0025BF855B|nr:hypothetical protein [Alistipes sp.]